ncbi:succinate dehydrogenase assembly factor 2 [Legionella dresdenensis]|uniref:FAD assembly factor SdhE n=1 Tax=Legionella dresdenensis TaxID=450200 RepID=A0ABV8CH08_9GAMM
MMIEAARKAKIKWQCRRGMLELDLILNRFIDNKLDNLAEPQILSFEKLLLTPDPELYSWLIDSHFPTDKEMLSIVELVKLHSHI